MTARVRVDARRIPRGLFDEMLQRQIAGRGAVRTVRRDRLVPAHRRVSWTLVRVLLVAASLGWSGRARGAVVLDDAVHFSIPRTFTLSPGVPRGIGGLMFSANGATLYVVAEDGTNTSKLYQMPVTRAPGTNEVTALGAATVVFSGNNPDPLDEAGLDAGLAFGPAGTFFYTYFATNFFGQRPGGFAGAE